MLGHFPAPYPDESLYSISARFRERAQYSSSKAILQELYGDVTATAVFYLPNRLGFLVSSLPQGTPLTVDRFIDQHTILPFFSAFLPPERVQIIRQDMTNGNGAAAHMRSGIMASRITMPKYLRCCPTCVHEDKKQFGNSYWHRLHQLPGVEVCPQHQVFLENSSVGIRTGRNKLQFISVEQILQAMSVKRIDLANKDHKVLLQIASDASWLLDNPKLNTNPKGLHNRYLRLLIDHGLATYTGSIHVKRLLEEFAKHYSSDLLQLLHCELRDNDVEKSSWLLRLARGSKHAQHPIYHLLLIQFLGRKAEDFFKLPEELSFFGEGPWPCLNHAAEHFGQPVIQKCTLSTRLRDNSPIGRFRCDCGFAYARAGPDSAPEDRFQIGKVISFGLTWETKLKELWQNVRLSLSEVGRRLGVDPLTVRRHATRLKLPFYPNGRRTKPLSPYFTLHREDSVEKLKRKRNLFRYKWLSAMKQKSQITMKSLRKALPKVYLWLLQNDSEWLKRNRPEPVKKKRARSSVDWNRRDVQYTILVKQSAARIRSISKHPKRITKTAIGRDLGVISLFQKHLNKMPLTDRMLASIVESSEEFSIRRVWWAADCYLQEGLFPQQWQLILRANVYRNRGARGVRDVIKSAMKMLNSELSQMRAAIA